MWHTCNSWWTDVNTFVVSKVHTWFIFLSFYLISFLLQDPIWCNTPHIVLMSPEALLAETVAQTFLVWCPDSPQYQLLWSGGIFCGMLFNGDLSDVILMTDGIYGAFEERPQKWSAVVITSCEECMPPTPLITDGVSLGHPTEQCCSASPRVTSLSSSPFTLFSLGGVTVPSPHSSVLEAES